MSAERKVSAKGDGTTSRPYRPGYELVAEQLLGYIAEQGLRPGARLPTEAGLAEILGTSRNVTREAVKVLAALGRLSVRRGAGIFVADSPGGLADDGLGHFQPTSMEHVLMLLDYRSLIEAETARRAAGQAAPIEVRNIRKGAERSLEAGRENDADAFAVADQLFHDAVGIAAHNIFLRSSVTNVRRLAAQSDVLLFHGDTPGSLEVAGHQHMAIADAIAAGDADRAAVLMTEHIATTRQQFERRIRDRLFNVAARGTEPAAGGVSETTTDTDATPKPTPPVPSAS
ncbi:FadR family transcriptional regulator [Streptomyces sp. Ru62]|uniref:FadR/GntR family transcriptional regulator n=1 Tax=Streptomyces sp. Ru62 TaxID=2080745 RepID=UPI000CDD280D|nr:FCD domain-containing protein [Streptomyces sp. Ru62]POX64526.1 FadR family transcriptional regulator [Streptomyces sp. Ru62]